MNDGYASVKMIAAWLADYPMASKMKMTTVLKGINVINKSCMFEKDLENVIIEESRIIKGSVSNEKDFFQTMYSMTMKKSVKLPRALALLIKRSGWNVPLEERNQRKKNLKPMTIQSYP